VSRNHLFFSEKSAEMEIARARKVMEGRQPCQIDRDLIPQSLEGWLIRNW